MNQMKRSRGTSSSVITLILILMVIGFSWSQCWYATPLSDAEMSRYLSGDGSESRIHKALSQFKERLDKKDESVERWFPEVAALASHKTAQIRSTAAWAMGAAPAHKPFEAVLTMLLDDSEVEVRYNAAVSLGARGITTARPILRQMLADYSVLAPRSGQLQQPRGLNQSTRYGQILGQILTAEGKTENIESPLSGRISKVVHGHGAKIESGDELFRIEPGSGQIENALLVLARIAGEEDIPALQGIVEGRFNVTEPTRQLARDIIKKLREPKKN